MDGDLLRLAQFLFVAGGSAADDVAEAGEEVLEDVGAEDRLTRDEPQHAHGRMASNCISRGDKHRRKAPKVQVRRTC
jgi:hypothetical protein